MAACLASTGAVAETLPEIVPADAMAAFFAASPECSTPQAPAANRDSAVRADKPDPLQILRFLSDQAFRIGLLADLDSDTRMWLDALSALADVQRYPFAVVLLDFSAKVRPDGGHELAGLQAALVIHTRYDAAPIERRIQHLLNTYTNTDQTRLTRTADGGVTVFTLTDRSLPDWAAVTWARVDDYFVIAVSQRAFQRTVKMVQQTSVGLGGDSWFIEQSRKIGAGVRRVEPAQTTVPLVLYVNFDRLRGRGDARLDAKIDGVKAALGLGGAQRGLFHLGRQGKAIAIKASIRREGGDELHHLADPGLVAGLPAGAVPQEAQNYAILNIRPLTAVQAVREAYLAAKSPRAAQGSRRFWTELEESAGVCIDEDILAPLGRPVMVHDYPQHALRLPLAWTIVIPVDRKGDELRRSIDRMFTVASAKLVEETLLQLRRDPEGVWYLQYGLAGPALTVTAQWVILSYSPYAVRTNAGVLSGVSSEPRGESTHPASGTAPKP